LLGGGGGGGGEPRVTVLIPSPDWVTTGASYLLKSL